MPVEVPGHVREAHEKAADGILKSVEQVRTTLGINRNRTSFHDMRFHFWREHKEIADANARALTQFQAFRKRHAGVMGARTEEGWLRASDAEIRNLAGFTNPQREELLGLLQALWATGGLQPLEGEVKEKALKERRTKIREGDATTFQDTLELDLFYRLLHASQVRENVDATTYNVLGDLNQRRLLSQVQQALIDDFLSMAENYANHIRVHAATLPENARNAEHEKRLQDLLTNLLQVAPRATAVHRVVYTENWLQDQQRYLKQIQEVQKKGGAELKQFQDSLAADNPPSTMELELKRTADNVELLQKNVKDLRQSLVAHERDVPCQEEVADADLAAFFARERTRLGNGVPAFEPAANPKRKRQLLEEYGKVLRARYPHITGLEITSRDTPQGLRWRITRTIRLSSTATTAALEEIYGELSRNILDTANASTPYQARNLGLMGAGAEHIRRFFGHGFPGPAGGEVPVRLGHAMYANMLLAHTQHATTNMGPSTTDAGRKEQIEKVMQALELSGQLGTAWRRYGNRSLSLISRYEGLLAVRGHFGPYVADEGGGWNQLDPDQLQHYMSRPLPLSIQRALSGGDFTVTSNALQQYTYIIRNDFAPRLQTVVLMNDGLERLNKILETINTPVNQLVLAATTLPVWYTSLLTEFNIPYLSPAAEEAIGPVAAAKARVDASERFRRAIIERRDRFQEALKGMRGRQEQLLKVVARVENVDKRLRELTVMTPPEHLLEGAPQRLKMGDEACAKLRKQYVDLIRELETATGDLAAAVNDTDQELDEIIDVRSLRSFQYGNLGAMGSEELVGIALGGWWTSGFQMGALGRLPGVRHIRFALAPWIMPFEVRWGGSNPEIARLSTQLTEVSGQLTEVQEELRELRARPAAQPADILRAEQQQSKLLERLHEARKQLVDANIRAAQANPAFNTLLGRLRATTGAAAWEANLVGLNRTHMELLAGNTAPAALEGVTLNGQALTATQIQELHALCRDRIAATTTGLNITQPLTSAQSNAIIRAHFATSNTQKILILRRAGFTTDQINFLLHPEIRIGGANATAAVPGGPLSAARPGPVGGVSPAVVRPGLRPGVRPGVARQMTLSQSLADAPHLQKFYQSIPDARMQAQIGSMSAAEGRAVVELLHDAPHVNVAIARMPWADMNVALDMLRTNPGLRSGLARLGSASAVENALAGIITRFRGADRVRFLVWLNANEATAPAILRSFPAAGSSRAWTIFANSMRFLGRIPGPALAAWATIHDWGIYVEARELAAIADERRKLLTNEIADIFSISNGYAPHKTQPNTWTKDGFTYDARSIVGVSDAVLCAATTREITAGVALGTSVLALLGSFAASTAFLAAPAILAVPIIMVVRDLTNDREARSLWRHISRVDPRLVPFFSLVHEGGRPIGVSGRSAADLIRFMTDNDTNSTLPQSEEMVTLPNGIHINRSLIGGPDQITRLEFAVHRLCASMVYRRMMQVSPVDTALLNYVNPMGGGQVNTLMDNMFHPHNAYMITQRLGIGHGGRNPGRIRNVNPGVDTVTHRGITIPDDLDTRIDTLASSMVRERMATAYSTRNQRLQRHEKAVKHFDALEAAQKKAKADGAPLQPAPAPGAFGVPVREDILSEATLAQLQFECDVLGTSCIGPGLTLRDSPMGWAGNQPLLRAPDPRLNLLDLFTQGENNLLAVGARRVRLCRTGGGGQFTPPGAPAVTDERYEVTTERPAAGLLCDGYVLDWRDGSTTSKVFFAWDGTTWWWSTPTSPNWVLASGSRYGTSSGASGAHFNSIADLLYWNEQALLSGPAERKKLTGQITARLTALQNAPFTAGVRLPDTAALLGNGQGRPDLRSELFNDNPLAPYIFTFGTFPFPDEAHIPHRTALQDIVKRTRALYPTAGPEDFRPQVMQLRNYRIFTNGREYEVLHSTVLCCRASAPRPVPFFYVGVRLAGTNDPFVVRQQSSTLALVVPSGSNGQELTKTMTSQVERSAKAILDQAAKQKKEKAEKMATSMPPNELLYSAAYADHFMNVDTANPDGPVQARMFMDGGQRYLVTRQTRFDGRIVLRIGQIAADETPVATAEWAQRVLNEEWRTGAIRPLTPSESKVSQDMFKRYQASPDIDFDPENPTIPQSIRTSINAGLAAPLALNAQQVAVDALSRLPGDAADRKALLAPILKGFQNFIQQGGTGVLNVYMQQELRRAVHAVATDPINQARFFANPPGVVLPADRNAERLQQIADEIIVRLGA